MHLIFDEWRCARHWIAADCIPMPVARAQFAGTHLENAPQWLLEIEALLMGGWEIKRGPRAQMDDNIARHRGSASSSSALTGRLSPTSQYRMDRSIRIAEPRAAARPTSAVRHHHFEQKVILASAKGTISVAEKRAAYGEGFNASDSLIPGDVRATNEAAYTEGGKSTEAERVVYIAATNGSTYDDRMRFWDLANEHAHFVGSHKISVTTRGVDAAWDQATRDATMPDALRETIAKAKASDGGEASIMVNDAGVVKRWLAKRMRSFPAELRPHIALETPHNSRIAYSIVGQFPHDMSPKGMRDCLDKMVDEFTVRQLPCQAVIHEPTAKNSKKNWHFQLIYYAGEAEQLADGRWSFERERQRDKWGTMKSIPLKRMGRNAEVGAEDWVPKLKNRWSEIVNTQAIAEGITTRFTNERNEQRGLPKPQTRYTPGRQALHAKGHFTDAEVDQNIASWQLWRKRKKAQLLKSTQSLRHDLERLRAQAQRTPMPPPSLRKAEARLDRAALVANDLDVLIDTAVHAAMLRQMILSGPSAIISHYSATDEALSRKRATPARTVRRDVARTVCEAAHTHLAGLDPILQQLATTQEAAVAKLKEARAALRKFLPTVEAELVAMRVDASAAPTLQLGDGAPPAMSPRTRQALAAHLASGREGQA
ncbi:hypothetical protein [Sphingomonas sp. PP-CC-1A-547]|uniref:hypothetical protein n=1 Tax=Sphingomonas sp. PP-CC-1A-547 TaxID=2135654 RepID=UPI0011C381EC|nr:hypothetical protein [Sphingomonas sp. PP-CC-1A-547]